MIFLCLLDLEVFTMVFQTISVKKRILDPLYLQHYATMLSKNLLGDPLFQHGYRGDLVSKLLSFTLATLYKTFKL